MTLWSEENKIYNVMIPAADPFDSASTTSAVHLENYKRLTYLLPTGVATSGQGVVTVNAAESASGAGTAIAFKYRTCSSAGEYGTLIDATSTGFTMTQQRAGYSYVIDVNVADIAAASTGYDYSTLTVTEGDQNTPAVVACVIAVLSEPRYPQGILQHTALIEQS